MHGYKRFITNAKYAFVFRSLNLTMFSCFLIKLYIYIIYIYIYKYTNMNNWPLRPRPTSINVLTPCVTIIYFKSVLE